MKRSPMPRRKARLRSRSELRRRTAEHRQRRELDDARAVVRDRADGWCEAVIDGVCAGRGSQAHHVQRRSQGGPDTAENLLWLCAACHQRIHDRPEWAKSVGFLRSRPVPGAYLLASVAVVAALSAAVHALGGVS